MKLKLCKKTPKSSFVYLLVCLFWVHLDGLSLYMSYISEAFKAKQFVVVFIKILKIVQKSQTEKRIKILHLGSCSKIISKLTKITFLEHWQWLYFKWNKKISWNQNTYSSCCLFPYYQLKLNSVMLFPLI